VLRRRHAGPFRANAGEQEAGIERWATRYFDDPRTPVEARRFRARLVGLHYNWIARNHRRAGDAAAYRRCFHKAVRLRPSLLLHPRRLVRYVGSLLRPGGSVRPTPAAPPARGAWRTARAYARILTRTPLRNLATRRALRRWFVRPLLVVADGFDRGPASLCVAPTRDGGTLAYRAGTADPIVLREILAADAYRLDRLPPGRVPWIVDVGGHIGLFAWRAAPHAERLLTFEPVPDNFALLERNLAGPAFAHVERVNAAVADHAGTLRLFLGGKNTGGHTSFPAHVPAPGAHVDVPCVALAAELEARGVRRVGLLKLDCEGGEYAVLDGLASYGLDRIDRIAKEYHPLPSPGSPAHSGEALEARLRAAGFAVDRVPGKRAGGGLLFATRVG
jgi:FkbM family methyltransferase